jgi:hypothetical protein
LSPFFKFQSLKVKDLIELGEGKTGSYQWTLSPPSTPTTPTTTNENDIRCEEFYAPYYCWDRQNIPVGWLKYKDC